MKRPLPTEALLLEETYAKTRLPVDFASTLIPDAYVTPEFHALEQERVFARSWVPVCVPDEVREPGQFHVVEVAELVGQLGRLRVEAHEDEAAPLGDAHSVQAHVGFVEGLDVCHVKGGTLVLWHLAVRRKERRAEAAPVEVIRPRVVRAGEEALDPTCAFAEARAAVAADVVVCP